MHQIQMTEAEVEAVLDKARELSLYFRELGPKYDLENTFAYPTIEPFKKSGLAGLNVPKEYGGLGGDILTLTKVVSELSRGDSAITLAYNMHFIMVGITMNLMSDVQNKYWLGRIAEGELLFGPFSEARAGFSGLSDTTAVPQPGGGWKLYGKKTWGTLCEAATIVTTAATITDADGNLPEGFEDRVNAESLFIADFKVDEDGIGDGVRIERTWDAIGMHATGTQVIVFDGFYIPEDGFVCEWRQGGFNNLEWASLMFASIYNGMSQRVFEEATDLLKKKKLGATFGAIVAAETQVAKVGHIIDGIGDMAVRCETNRRVLEATCQQLIDGRDDEWPTELRIPFIGIAKTFIADNVQYMTRRAMSLVGGSSFRKGSIFERLYRDASASMFQPLNKDQTYAAIGEYYLAPDELND
jgi:alkylation response protein AidB-like acyl-CoA dehydrogenase